MRRVLASVSFSLMVLFNSPCSSQVGDWNRIFNTLPGWPIKDVGPKISQEVIDHWKTFGFQCPASTVRGHSSYPSKWSASWPDNCDDLDATMFNGLLCAVGVEEGCNGVRDAQGRVNGKQFFYRSPRQRWNNAAVTAPAILDQILPIPAAARDEAIALKLRANFPLHLEAVRVFLRIMQRNPDLSIERFPPGSLPTLNIDSVDLRSSENPFALHARAQTIYSRQKWNPFYRLLAEGPTKATRKQLLLLCPTMDVQPSEPVKRTAWVWRWETDKVNERPYTMGGGWDCVFAGMLYNKMRVEDDVRKRLFQLFDELSDPAGRLLSRVNADLSKALALADKLEHESQRFSKIVNDAKANALKETYRLRDEAQSSLAGIQNLAYAKKKEVADLAKDIEGKMPNCDGGDVCRRVKKRVRRALKHLYDRLNTLVSQASASADQLNKTNAAIAAYSQTIASWSDQALQGAQKTALEASAKARSTAGELKAKAERLQANREKAREHLKVWRS